MRSIVTSLVLLAGLAAPSLAGPVEEARAEIQAAAKQLDGAARRVLTPDETRSIRTQLESVKRRTDALATADPARKELIDKRNKLVLRLAFAPAEKPGLDPAGIQALFDASAAGASQQALKDGIRTAYQAHWGSPRDGMKALLTAAELSRKPGCSEYGGLIAGMLAMESMPALGSPFSLSTLRGLVSPPKQVPTLEGAASALEGMLGNR